MNTDTLKELEALKDMCGNCIGVKDIESIISRAKQEESHEPTADKGLWDKVYSFATDKDCGYSDKSDLRNIGYQDAQRELYALLMNVTPTEPRPQEQGLREELIVTLLKWKGRINWKNILQEWAEVESILNLYSSPVKEEHATDKGECICDCPDKWNGKCRKDQDGKEKQNG
jgi:hypothetical protein